MDQCPKSGMVRHLTITSGSSKIFDWKFEFILVVRIISGMAFFPMYVCVPTDQPSCWPMLTIESFRKTLLELV